MGEKEEGLKKKETKEGNQMKIGRNEEEDEGGRKSVLRKKVVMINE